MRYRSRPFTLQTADLMDFTDFSLYDFMTRQCLAASCYTLYVLELVSPPLPVQLVWKNSPRGLSILS